METYPRAAVERAMKIQEVILRAVAKKINWTQAGEIIGLCERQMRRWKQRYQEFGYDGLFDRRLGKPRPCLWRRYDSTHRGSGVAQTRHRCGDHYLGDDGARCPGSCPTTGERRFASGGA